jgi:enterochelin esterase-like enzyme
MFNTTVPRVLAELGPAPTNRQLERLLEGLGNPIHEEGDTILIHRADAEVVRLRTFMPRFPTPPPFTRMPGTDVWYLRMRLPATARIEYRLAIGRGNLWTDIVDPLNPPQASNPYGINSVAGGQEYRRPPWSLPDEGISHGRLTEIRVASTLIGSRRRYQLYLPHGYQRQPLPLLVIHDGSDYRAHADLLTVLDNLVGSGQIEPLLALLHDPLDRLSEYAANPLHAQHLVEEVIPHLHRRYRLLPDPGGRVLMGASMGAVASLATAWQYPEQFGGLLLQSGSYVHRPDGYSWHQQPPPDHDLRPIFSPVADFLEGFDHDARFAAYRVFVSAGRYEGVIDYNRRLVPRLRSAGCTVRYRETWDGHDWGSWRDRLLSGLTFLLPGPSAATVER